jgi:4-hydroxybenzoate polyprenyltransferase/phosphoserine phosphatase
VVDLDGTLIRSDLLVESFLALLGSDPLGAARAALALRDGKAALKAAIADRALIDVATLPFDDAVLALVAQARAEGRKTFLYSASDERYVRAVAEHLGLFDGAVGTTGGANLSGEAKARRLVETFGEGGFDYVGDAAVDVAVWARARTAYAVAPSAALQRRIARAGLAAEVVGERSGRARAYLKAIRPHQWMKNVLIFLPALAGHAFTLPTLGACVAAFISFSLCASSVYLLNDLLDLKSDREHARKRLRPFASGRAPLAGGLMLAPALLAGALAIAVLLPDKFLWVLGGYYALTLAYSLGLKRLMSVDVITLACLYGARVIAGSAASGVPISPWLEALSVFFFLSLALVKRVGELSDRMASGKGDPAGRGYRLSDLPMVESMGAASGFVAVLVLALYLNSPDVARMYHSPHRLWALCVITLFWICRMLMKAHRGEMHDDPVVFALRDRASQACGVIGAGIVASAL